ncbi:MAG: hypothetical protein DBX39_03845 [Bacillota bacterium]|nr:MAG: hypothetical protein DBX39_03845 [Bacillota bacterium]
MIGGNIKSILFPKIKIFFCTGKFCKQKRRGAQRNCVPRRFRCDVSPTTENFYIFRKSAIVKRSVNDRLGFLSVNIL